MTERKWSVAKSACLVPVSLFFSTSFNRTGCHGSCEATQHESPGPEKPLNDTQVRRTSRIARELPEVLTNVAEGESLEPAPSHTHTHTHAYTLSFSLPSFVSFSQFRLRDTSLHKILSGLVSRSRIRDPEL